MLAGRWVRSSAVWCRLRPRRGVRRGPRRGARRAHCHHLELVAGAPQDVLLLVPPVAGDPFPSFSTGAQVPSQEDDEPFQQKRQQLAEQTRGASPPTPPCRGHPSTQGGVALFAPTTALLRSGRHVRTSQYQLRTRVENDSLMAKAWMATILTSDVLLVSLQVHENLRPSMLRIKHSAVRNQSSRVEFS